MILLFFYGLCNLLLGHIFDDVIFFLDPCVDVTCNDQGKVDTSTDTCACLCFHGFTGDNCETEGN